jgi:hypothetical protein
LSVHPGEMLVDSWEAWLTRGDIREFESIAMRDEFGVVKDHTFTLFDDPRDMLLAGGGPEFHICVLEGRQIGGFVNQPVPPEQRAGLAGGKPAWLDVLLFVEVADAKASPPLVDVQVLTPQGADPAECAIVSALLAVETGEVDFDWGPFDYLVRFAAGGRMRVTLYDDEQSELWHGVTRLEGGLS